MSDGARWELAVSLHGFRVTPSALRLVGQAIVLGAMLLLCLACERQSQSLGPGLPPDLPQYLGQIRSLKVPSTVTHLDWIPSNLKELDASETAITAIPFVPRGLERLDVHKAKDLAALPPLPPSIRELDIRLTKIGNPGRFPQELETLALSGNEQVKALDGLSGSLLRELSLEQVPGLRPAVGFPANLQYLEISGELPQLMDLPARLKELRLKNTNIRTLKGLPETLQRLTLDGNEFLEEAEIPHNILSLTASGSEQRILHLNELEFLNHLDLRSPPGVLPPFLRDVQISRGSFLPRVVSSVRRLRILNEGDEILPELPPTLEELRWPGGADLGKLPVGLKILDIQSSPLKDLSQLPREIRLEGLDISVTDIEIDTVPASLTELRYRFCPFKEIKNLPAGLIGLDISGSRNVVALRVPSRLERLDVSETSITELPDLPETLTELDISKTNIKSLRDLEALARLRKLTVHAGQFESLSGLPKSVAVLNFVDP